MQFVRVALAAIAASALATPLAAQASCDIDLTKPFQLNSAALYLARHDQATSESDRQKNLRSAVNVLTDNPGRIRNESGRNFLLGQAFVIWFKDAGSRLPLRAKRGDIGMDENPEGDFSLPEAIDEAFGIVEREKPACAERTARFRNAVFNDLLNKAIAYSRAAQHDSAIAWANSALRVNARSPLASTAHQVIAVSTYNLGIVTRDDALAKSGDARSAGLRRAAALFQGYLDLAPAGELAVAARAARMQALRDAGDSASVHGIQDDMLANPGKYSALQLFEAGVMLANGRRWEEAARLYVEGLRMNPFHRDALYNLGNAYLALHRPDSMGPVVDRLRAADPMNPDVLRLTAAVWQERAASARDAAARALAEDSANAWLERAGRLPARVVVRRFLVGRDGVVSLTGAVENLTARPLSGTITFELLDKDGAVTERAEVEVVEVAPKAATEFSRRLTGATAVAWRYSFK